MDLRKKLMLLFVAFGLLSLLGAAGCKNVCEKAAAHYRDCYEQVCSGDDKPATCPAEAPAEVSGDIECADAVKTASEEMLNKSCEELYGISEASE